MIADEILWPEGEKDVDSLSALNLPAFTFGGVGDGLPDSIEHYSKDRRLVILVDNDDPGRAHTGRKAAIAHAAGAASIKIVHFSELPPKGDVSDFVASGGTAAQIMARADAASIWSPPATSAAAQAFDCGLITSVDDLAIGEEVATTAIGEGIKNGQQCADAVDRRWSGNSDRSAADALRAPGNGNPRRQQQTPRPSWRDNVMSAPDLCDQKFPELKFIVPGLFPEGVTLIVSRPKLGKSWLLLQIGAAIANGVSVLALGDHPLQGDVLYLNLEDGDRKAQRRMTKHFGALRQNWPGRMTIARSWRRFDQGGIDDLREWCNSVEKPTLINIDTLKRVRPSKKAGQTDYDADYEACQGLLQLAHDVAGLGVFVAHHDRKMDAEDVFDTVSGTLGLIGGVDTIAVLKRKAQGVSLHVEGRDLVDGLEKAIHFDRETCRWQILGEAAEFHRSAERTRVLNALKAAPAGLTRDQGRG